MAKKSKVIYNKDGIVRTEAQMRRSYNSYLKYRQNWISKGYAVDDKLTLEEYTKWHIAQSLMGGDPNIARTIAREELSYTATAARTIVKQVKKRKQQKPKKVVVEDYDIYDVDEYNEERQDIEREKILEKYSNWRNIVEAEDREEVFKELASAEIDIDMWKYDDDTRDQLYHDDLKRFREKFEANLYRS